MNKIILFSACLMMLTGCAHPHHAPAPALHKSAPHDKVTICHKGKTIVINSSALKAHLKHGDKMGPCP